MKDHKKIVTQLIAVLFMLLISLPATTVFAQTDSRPNIIYILGDNHNADTMSNAGHPFIETPGMDRLAKEGVKFDRTYNTTSLCSPSRASILTGTYAHKHGIKNNHIPWTGQYPVFLEHLSDQGYDTAFIGKWHMPGKGLPEMSFLDLFVSFTYREGQGAYFDCPMIVNGKEVPSRKRYMPEEITDYAIEFMEANQAKPEAERKPFMIYLAHKPGHPPYQAPEDIKGMYDDEDVTQVLPKNTDPLWYGKTKGNVFQGVMKGSFYDQYRKYCEVITAMDQNIQRLLNRVDEMGLAENTVAIYMGDNGKQWGTHDRMGIREPYEDSARLPLIVRAPGLIKNPGSLRQQLSLNIDIAPTILDLAGIEKTEVMDGESLVPILADKDGQSRDAFLMEYWRYYPENTPSYLGVVTDQYKYIEYEMGRQHEIFDLKNDPKERVNLYGTPEGEKILPGLKEQLAKLNKNPYKFH